MAGGHGGEHHHLICRRCGRTAEIAGSALERWLAANRGEQGSAGVTSSTGGLCTCPGCAAAALFRPLLAES